MSQSDLLYQIKENVAHLTINREERRNSLSPAVVTLFLEYLDRAEKDETVKVILITGAGEKAFCSGAELGDAMGSGSQAELEGYRSYARLLKRLAGFSKPVVARVNGYCLAAGLGIMLACDIVIARDDARFGAPEVNVGLFPMMIGALIFRNVLRKKGMEMTLLGHMLAAQEAEAMGLVTRIVPPKALDGEVNKTLELLAAKSPCWQPMVCHRSSS